MNGEIPGKDAAWVVRLEVEDIGIGETPEAVAAGTYLMPVPQGVDPEAFVIGLLSREKPDHLTGHAKFLDFLIERSLKAWTHSRG